MNRSVNQSLPLPGSRAHHSKRISQCVISFGSNLGDRRELITAAARRIAGSGVPHPDHPLRTSRLFQTPPIGGPGGQEPFLNAIGVFETVAPARRVLELLQTLESDLGRQRRHRWGARSIDLDVVLHGRLVGGAVGLVVPHPRYTARQFVLKPACDVAAHFRDPRFGWTLQELSNHLDRGVPSLALVSGSAAIRRQLCERLAAEHGIHIHSAVAGSRPERRDGPAIQPTDDRWVADFLPPLPYRPGESEIDPRSLPRLLVRIQGGRTGDGWPAPHQMWPSGWRWPEYRLEIDDPNWAVSELASALDSMRCEAWPVTPDGHWW